MEGGVNMSIDMKTLAVAKKTIGAPTDQQVGDAVSAYLDRHPVQPYDDTEVRRELSTLSSDIAALPQGVLPNSTLVMGDGNVLYTRTATQYYINNRYNSAVITPETFDAMMKAAMCDGKGAAWTAEEQQAAQQRLGINKEWVLKGTMTSAEPLVVDLTGCTELYIVGWADGTANATLSSNISWLAYNLIGSGTRFFAIRYVDSPVGYDCVSCAGGTGNKQPVVIAATGSSIPNGYACVNGKHIADINNINISVPSAVTSCEIKVYAR